MVAIAYLPNPNNLPEVNHIDYDRRNPDVSNLEWISRKDNVIYSNCNRPNYFGSMNPNYHNKTLSNKYAMDKTYAKDKQSRPALQNGRCRKIKMFLDGNFVEEFCYITDCCKYIKEYYSPTCTLEGIRCQIDRTVRNGKLYKGLSFVKG